MIDEKHLPILKDSLESEVANAGKMRGEFLERAANDMTYALGWAESMMVEHECGVLAAKALAYGDHLGDLIAGLREVCEEVHEVLIKNQLAGRSTSAYSNAGEAAKREAYGLFYGRWYSQVKQEPKMDAFDKTRKALRDLTKASESRNPFKHFSAAEISEKAGKSKRPPGRLRDKPYPD